MAYHIEIKQSAVRELAKIPKAQRRLVSRKIDALANDPHPKGHRKLKGRQEEAYRIRAGDYRIIYQVQEKKLTVFVIRIGHRKEVYRKP